MRHRLIVTFFMAALICGTASSEETRIVIGAGIESTGTYYKIVTSEEIEQVDGELDGHPVTIGESDQVSGNIAVGYIKFGKDGFRTEGELVSLEMENPAAVDIYVNGVRQDVLPAPGSAPQDETAEPDTEPEPDSSASSDTQSSPTTIPSRRRDLADLRRTPLSPPSPSAEIGETEKNDTAPQMTAIVLKPQPVPLIIADTAPASAEGKDDKGNEVTETTPVLNFEGGEAALSPVSGERGEQILLFDFRTRPLNAINWSENSDKVCAVTAVSRLADQPKWWRTVQKCASGPFACESEICKQDEIDARRTGKEDRDRNLPSLGGDFDVTLDGRRPAVSSLRVCTNGRNNGRVKGIEINGIEILEDGKLGTNYQADQHKLSHCREWEPLVLCPTGTVATGLRAHFNPGSGLGKNTSQLVGLQLACRKPEAG